MKSTSGSLQRKQIPPASVNRRVKPATETFPDTASDPEFQPTINYDCFVDKFRNATHWKLPGREEIPTSSSGLDGEEAIDKEESVAERRRRWPVNMFENMSARLSYRLW